MKIALTGTKSKKNVLTAFALESQARNKYAFFADKAREEGREDIAALFERMARNEKEHARIWYSILMGGIAKSEENLKNAAHSENIEWKSLYPGFAREAREEGLEELAVMFEKIASIEYDHERRFMEAVLKMQGNAASGAEEVNREEKAGEFYCIFCGHMSSIQVDRCPTCGAKDSFST